MDISCFSKKLVSLFLFFALLVFLVPSISAQQTTVYGFTLSVDLINPQTGQKQVVSSTTYVTQEYMDDCHLTMEMAKEDIAALASETSRIRITASSGQANIPNDACYGVQSGNLIYWYSIKGTSSQTIPELFQAMELISSRLGNSDRAVTHTSQKSDGSILYRYSDGSIATAYTSADQKTLYTNFYPDGKELALSYILTLLSSDRVDIVYIVYQSDGNTITLHGLGYTPLLTPG